MVERLAALWRRLGSGSYPGRVGIARRGPTPAVPPPPDLANYRGMWVAVVDGRVVAAAETPKKLVHELGKLDRAVREEAVMQKAHAPSDAVLIGLG